MYDLYNLELFWASQGEGCVVYSISNKFEAEIEYPSVFQKHWNIVKGILISAPYADINWIKGSEIMLLEIGLIEMWMVYFPQWTISKALNGFSGAASGIVDVKKWMKHAIIKVKYI